jgi:Cytochrome c3
LDLFSIFISLNRRGQVKLCLILTVCIGFVTGAMASQGGVRDDNCLKCHTQATGRAGEVVEIHRSSIHGRGGVRCDSCHGGDPAQTVESRAHEQKFTGKPDRAATLVMCGNCHQQQLAQFTTSRHFPEARGLPRIDCADCHGAHSIGNPPDGFGFSQFCASCHGLEYLPALPQPFQDLLALSDELTNDLKRLRATGVTPPDEVTRRELRRLTAEIVHPADRDGGLRRIPQILSRGEKLREEIKKLR